MGVTASGALLGGAWAFAFMVAARFSWRLRPVDS
jgi:hypothetical protein